MGSTRAASRVNLNAGYLFLQDALFLKESTLPHAICPNDPYPKTPKPAGLPMSSIPALDGIHELLVRAQRDLVVPLKVKRRTVSLPMHALPESYRRRNLAIKLVGDGVWPTNAPALHAIQHWIGIHWNAERSTQQPPGTVLTHRFPAPQCEPRLDDAIASRKLVVAAAMYGAETAARCAVVFARYGMVETRTIHLLKGPLVDNPQRLDDFCSLLPYRQALRRANSFFDPGTLKSPPEEAEGRCALECIHFTRPTPHPAFGDEWFGSGLTQDGAETLALLIGLVWGTGLRVIQSWRATARTVEAVLPYWLLSGGGGVTHPVELLPKGFPRLSKQRPLPVRELSELMGKLHGLASASRRRLNVALRRLRNACEKLDEEDRAIDLCIALEALFMEEGEWNGQRKIIARRGSWHFADSLQERQRIRDALKDFYELRSRIVHGNPATPQTPDEERRRSMLISEVLDFARTSLKTMIAEGRPQDWGQSTDHTTIRHDPPRDESQIPSVKSDSLSWTVKEQKDIDRALESAWRPSVDEASTLPPDTEFTIHHGIRQETVEEIRRQGRHCVIRHPAVLYMAHPKWPNAESDPLDERTEFYCERDVEKHMLRWMEAASNKRLDQFEIPWDASFFHPKYRRFCRSLCNETKPETDTSRSGTVATVRSVLCVVILLAAIGGCHIASALGASDKHPA